MAMSPISKSEVAFFILYLLLGLFIWRGTEKPFEITDHPSYEYHTFTKLDVKDPKTRNLVEEYWCNMTEDTKV